MLQLLHAVLLLIQCNFFGMKLVTVYYNTLFLKVSLMDRYFQNTMSDPLFPMEGLEPLTMKVGEAKN